MPKIQGRRSTRKTWPVNVLGVISFVSPHAGGGMSARLVGRACDVTEHEGERVFWPQDFAKYREAAEREYEGGHRAASHVGLKNETEWGPDTPIGIACPACTDLILGFGSGKAPQGQFSVDGQTGGIVDHRGDE